MTTKTKEAPPKPQTEVPEAAQKPQPAKLLSELLVPLDAIVISGQHRRHFGEKALKELAGNIGSIGLINPITLRPGTNGKEFILVAGERRVRAAKLAGMTALPARVMAMTDTQALEFQAAENIHRQDLTPIEEARAFRVLLDAHKFDVRGLAETVDKSEAYVYRAVHLLELPKDFQDEIESGHLTAAHGHQVLRVPAEARDALVKFALQKQYDDHLPTAKDLADWIGENTSQDLEAAGFPKDRTYADMQACTKCGFNSENHGTLFPEAEGGSCTNAKCFQAKMKKHYWDMAAALEKKHPGIKYVGAGAVKGYGEEASVKGGLMLNKRTEGLSEIKKAIVREPEKFGIAVVSRDPNSQERGTRAVIVVMDDELKKKLLPKHGRSGGNEPREDWQRGQHVQSRIDCAMGVAVLKAIKVKALPKEAKQAALTGLLERTDKLTEEMIAEAWGDKAIEAEDVFKLLWVMTILNYEGIDQKATAWLKLDIKGIAKTVSAAAGIEYDAAKKAKEEEAAKAQTPEKQGAAA